MSNSGFNEKDWKLFRKKLPDWQEAYMEKLCRQYIRILTEDSNPSERFWTLEKKINQDKMDAGVQLEEMSRSRMRMNIIALLKEGAIDLDDLDGFSEEFIESVSWTCDI